MDLTLRDAARLFDTAEETIESWIEERHLPACRVHDQFRFNREELLSWATTNNVKISQTILKTDALSPIVPDLAVVLKNGGIHYHVPGQDKMSVLKSVSERMPLPASVGRDFFLQVLLAREALSSTGLGNGIAIPHPRNPIVLNVDTPTIALFFLETPIDFGAIDNLPVHTLFTLISPNVRMHLQLLSRLAFALQDAGFKSALEQHVTQDVILAAAQLIDSRLAGQPVNAPS